MCISTHKYCGKMCRYCKFILFFNHKNLIMFIQSNLFDIFNCGQHGDAVVMSWVQFQPMAFLCGV